MTADPATGRHIKEYCHGDESQDDEDSGKEVRREEARQGHEVLELDAAPPTLIPAPLRPSVPGPSLPSAEKTQIPVEAKKLSEWVVREVINGTAILKGPWGIIGVSIGDLVPGVGRVQSIARQGGRWTVATNKGVITAR
jgi:hypothetical protein